MILGSTERPGFWVSDRGSELDDLLRDWVERSVYDESGRVLGERPRFLERPNYNFQLDFFSEPEGPGSSPSEHWFAPCHVVRGLSRIPLPRSFEAASRPWEQVVRSLWVSDSPQGLASYTIPTASNPPT